MVGEEEVQNEGKGGRKEGVERYGVREKMVGRERGK